MVEVNRDLLRLGEINTHNFEETFSKDIIKKKALNKLGVNVLRFKDEEVMNNIEGVLEAIKGVIKRIESKHTPQSPLNRGENVPQSTLSRGEDKNPL